MDGGSVRRGASTMFFVNTYTQLGRHGATEQTYFTAYIFFLYAKLFLKKLLRSI